MNTFNCAIKLCLLSFCLFVTGCANHIKIDTLTETEITRDQLSHSVDIETNAGSLVTNPLINVNVKDNKTFNVKTFEKKSDFDLSTPYEGVRELYEFPMGVVLLPVAVVVNVLDFATLGLLPDRFTDAVLDSSFSGMNPFLNIESETRVERKLVKSDSKIVDEKEEYFVKPLSSQELSVSTGNGDGMQVMLDVNGKAEVSLVRLSTLSMNIENVILTVKSEDVTTQKDIDVSRQLRSQLVLASDVTNKYANLAKNNVKNEDIQNIDIDVFAKDLMSLTRIGFESESLRIEKKLKSLMLEDQKTEFDIAMDNALTGRLEN